MTFWLALPMMTTIIVGFTIVIDRDGKSFIVSRCKRPMGDRYINFFDNYIYIDIS